MDKLRDRDLKADREAHKWEQSLKVRKETRTVGVEIRKERGKWSRDKVMSKRKKNVWKRTFSTECVAVAGCLTFMP